ncbi:BamA/TamA family outer membrane protein [Lewinella sp. LCG006]|uniref:BamA/TamA family outer membrane protein n=1 Tax=Lewinella sp. LCG006 TaxID=3231911 RepID=UPI00345F8A5C
MRPLLVIGCLLLLAIEGIGQVVALRILTPDADLGELRKFKSFPDSTFTDSLQLNLSLSTFLNDLQEGGYLEASTDTLLVNNNRYTAILHLGPIYRWVTLSGDDIPKEWLSKAGFRSRLYSNKPLEINRWLQFQQQLAGIAANNGFPFAKVMLDSIIWQAPGALEAKIKLQRGPLIFFEKIDLTGEAQISTTYLHSHLGLFPGQVYNEALIRKVQQRIQELPFVQLQEAPRVQFIGDQARLILKLAPKKASRFDFIVGVLPQSQQTGRLLVTAQLEGALQNALGKGERVAIAFEQLRPLTQELDLAFNYPYLLNLPFGVDAQLNLYKRDTNFINLNWQLGIDYLLSGGRSVQAFWSQNQTNLLSIDSFQIQQLDRLPDTLDVRRRTFGLRFHLNQLDYRTNPTKGWDWQLSAGVGQKTIRRNASIESAGFDNLYDSLTLRSAQYRLETSLARYQNIGQRSVIKTALTGAAILAPEPVLANEQLRIGGNQLLRGFDEEGIFATNFALLTLEYRFLLTTNSYLYSFFDWARVDNASLNSPPDIGTIFWYQGIGAGITFETRAGLFGLSIALGRQDQQPFDFGAPKVHFGYVSLF